MRRAIPDSVDALVDTIIRAEREINPILCDTETRRWPLQGRRVLFDPRGHGASSELPPLSANQARWRRRATLARRLPSDITGHAGALSVEYPR